MANPLAEKLKKMHPQDREVIEEQRNALAEQMAIIQHGDVGAAANLDQGAIQRQLNQKERILADDEKLIAKGVAKDRLAKEARELEEVMKKDMCSRNELWTKSGTMDSERAIQKQIAFEKTHGNRARRWQEIQACLEPNDPMNCNMERIRPD